jgi:signal transduction histidine kinase
MTRNARGRRPADGDIAVPQRDDDKGTPDNGFGQRGLRHSFLHNQSVQVRVAGLVLIPLLGALVFGASVFYDALRDWSTANAAERNAHTARAVLNVVDHLQDERDVTSLQRADVTGDSAVVERRDQTDLAIQNLQQRLADLPIDDESPISESATRAQAELADIASYREGSLDSYRFLINTLLEFVRATGAGLTDPDLVVEIGALDSLARGTEAASLERGLLAQLLAIGASVEDARVRFATVTRTEQDLLLERYASWASPSDWVEYTEARRAIETLRRDVLNPATSSYTPTEWFTVASERIDIMRDLQGSVANSIVSQAADAASSARLAAIGTAAIVLAMLVLTISVAYAVARSIVRPLRRLRGAALEVADTGLPRLVARIQDDGPAAVRNIGDAVTPEGTDEIGQVASAFNEVHATAIRVAGEQALLRQNLDTIVVNLSRRTQSLIDRQLGEIEDLESRERDPDQLGTLFRIDHLATRVRRHAESLLVLAGVEEMRRQGVAAPVLDVVRTAVGEVEQYPRIKFGVMPTDLVVPTAVDDVAHLLAELLDNATEFSAPSTPVTVTSQPLLGGGLRLQVTDQGLGIPTDQLAMLNERLREPGDIDVAASRTLGIYVVARLAARHGITVRLIPAEATSGTIAQVDLPAHLIVSPLDTTDGVLQAIQPSATPPSTSRTESLLGASRPPADSTPPPKPAAPAHPGPAQPAPAQPAIPAPASQLPQRPAATPIPPTQQPPAPAAPVAPGHPHPTGQPAGPPAPMPPPPPAPMPQPAAPNSLPSRQPVHAEAKAPQPASARSLRAPEPPMPTGDSPIYDAVRSAWFKRGSSLFDWSSPADEGWRRAAQALQTAEDAAARQGTSSGPASQQSTQPITPQPPRPAPPRPEQPAPPRPVAQPAPPRPAPPRPGPAAPPRPVAQPAPPRPDRPVAPQPTYARQPAPDRSAPAPWTSPAPTSGMPGSGYPGARPATGSAGGDDGPAGGQPDDTGAGSGLPVRQRGATLVPGSIPGAEEAARQSRTGRRPADAGNVASTLSNLQRGVSRGREESGGWVPKRPSDSERSNS